MNEGTRPTISVVIVTYNDRIRLADCLHSVFGQQPACDDVEAIVVDDGSDDGTPDMVRENFPDVRLICKAHSGADNSRNAGIDAATGEVVAFIDSDCTASPTWLAGIRRVLLEKQASIVGGRIVHAGDFWTRMVGVSDFGEFQSLKRREVSNIPTCNMAVRTECLRETRFDPELAISGDVVFCHSLHKRGITLLYDPELSVTHRPSVDRRAFFARARTYGRGPVGSRRRDPSLPYARLYRGGKAGVAVATLGRVVLDWGRLFRYRRPMGIRIHEVPAAFVVLLLKRIVSLSAALRADSVQED